MTLGQNLGILLFFLPIMATAQGFAVSKLWNWFVMHTFTNIHLGVCHAIGLIILWNVINFSGNKNNDRTFDEYVTMTLGISLACMIFVLGGWILKGWM